MMTLPLGGLTATEQMRARLDKLIALEALVPVCFGLVLCTKLLIAGQPYVIHKGRFPSYLTPGESDLASRIDNKEDPRKKHVNHCVSQPMYGSWMNTHIFVYINTTYESCSQPFVVLWLNSAMKTGILILITTALVLATPCVVLCKLLVK